MRGSILVGILGAAAMGLSACAGATQLLYSEDRLAELTAPQFGLSPREITIENRQATSMGTYYDVKLPTGRTVRCFHDGNVMGMGLMSNAPHCGASLGQNPVTDR